MAKSIQALSKERDDLEGEIKETTRLIQVYSHEKKSIVDMLYSTQCDMFDPLWYEKAGVHQQRVRELSKMITKTVIKRDTLMDQWASYYKKIQRCR